MNSNMPTYYAVLENTDEIIAENKSFILCMDEARAMFPTRPELAPRYFVTTENWFTRNPGALQRWANKKATAAARAKAEAESDPACSVLLVDSQEETPDGSTYDGPRPEYRNDYEGIIK